MSRRKKLVPEPTFKPVSVVKLDDEQKRLVGIPEPNNPEHQTIVAARAFVAIPTLPAPPLTAKERADIAAKAGIKLTNAEWGSVDQARQLYTAVRRNELNGVSARQLQIRLGKICKAADVLLDLMDGGPGKPGNRNTSKHRDDKNRLLSDFDRLSYQSVDEIAWKRVLDSEKPSFGHDDVYPCVSQLYRRATLAFEQSRSEAAMLGWPSAWEQLIWELAALFEAKGLKAARSKPADHGTTQQLSPFAKFVFAVWATLPDDVARPRRKGSAADILAIVRALEKRAHKKT
jgi:hypothetical protein